MSTLMARMCSKQLNLSRSLTGYYVAIVTVRMRTNLRGMARVYRFRKYLDKMVLINVAVCLLVSLTFYLPRDSSAASCQILCPTPKQWQNQMSGRTLMCINWINNYIAFNINIDPKCSYCTELMWYWLIVLTNFVPIAATWLSYFKRALSSNRIYVLVGQSW